MSAGTPVRADRSPGERGAALVELLFLAVVLMVPLVYLVMVAASVQRAAFAAAAAVRDAGRAYATAAGDADGRVRARAAARVALAGAGAPWTPGAGFLRCDPQPCGFTPGSLVTVRVRLTVPLPGLAGLLCGPDGCPAGVPVSAAHSQRLDCYAGPPVDPPTGTAAGRC